MSHSEPDLTHADEIAAAMRRRCVERIRESDQLIPGVVFSTADVLYLLDAYEASRALLGEVVDWLGVPDWSGPQLPDELARRIADSLR